MQKNLTSAPQQNSQKRFGLVLQEGNDSFKQLFDYQKYIKAQILWTSKDSVLRIIPGNDGTHLYPQVINGDRWSPEADQSEFLSDTFFMTQTLSRFGDSAMDICANLDPTSDEAAVYRESPLSYFCNTVNRVMRAVNLGKPTKVKYTDEWRAWTGMNGKLPAPKVTLFFQAICISINGRECKSSTDEDAQTAPLYGVIGINQKQSIQEFMKALVFPQNRALPPSSKNNQYGSLAEAEGNILYLNTASLEGRKYLAPSIQETGAVGWNPTEYNIPEDTCKAIWNPWNRLFRYLTVKEQIDLLISEFGSSTVEYVFSLSPQWKNLNISSPKATVATPQAIPKLSKPSLPNLGVKKVEEPEYKAPGISGTVAAIGGAGIDMEALQAEIKKVTAGTKSKAASLADELQAGLDDDDLK